MEGLRNFGGEFEHPKHPPPRYVTERIPTDYDVSECEREASIMSRPWPIGGMLRHGRKEKVPGSEACRHKDVESARGEFSASSNT